MVALTTGPAAADAPLVGATGTMLPWSSATNSPSYWEDYGPHDDAQCYSHDSNSDHGSITNGGLTVTLNAFGADWPGDHWELLVIKGGSVSNNVIVHPTPGVAYASPLNNSGNQANVSHWIVCKGTTPTPTVTATAPTFTDAVCTGAGQVGQGSYTIPAKAGVRYEVNIQGDGLAAFGQVAGTYPVAVGTTVEVFAYAEPGYLLTGADDWDDTISGPQASKCVLPATPTFNGQVCTGPGTKSQASYIVPSTANVQYQRSINDGSWNNISAQTVNVNSFPVKIEIRAVVNSPYVVVPGSIVEWSFNFTSAGDCITIVTPTVPTYADGLCYAAGQNSAGSYTIPAAVAGTKYQVKFSAGGVYADKAAGTYPLAVGDDVYIQAVALTGYGLSGTTSWYFVIGGPDGDDCVAPAVPSLTQSSCTGPGTSSQASYTVPASTGIQYQVWNGSAWVNVGSGSENVNTFPTTIKFKAIAAPGYVIVPGSTTEWELTLNSPGDCLEGVTAIADIDQAVCTGEGTGVYEDGSYTISTTEGVYYQVSLNAGVAETKAAGTYTVPIGTVVLITAHAESGYTLVGATSWTDTIDPLENCVKVEGDPTFHEGCDLRTNTFIEPHFIVVAADHVTYTWELNDVPQGAILPGTHYVDAGDKVEVTAHAEPGFELNQSPWQWTWTFDEVTETCEIDPPVLTCEIDEEGFLDLPELEHGDWIVDGVNEGSGPLSVQLSIVDVHITVEAEDGYEFGDGKKSWIFELDGEGECGQLDTLPPIPTAAVATNQQCVDGKVVGATLTVGQVDDENWFPEVNYYLDGSVTPLAAITTPISVGNHVVTADPVDPDDDIADGYDDEWEFTVLAAPAPCGDLTTLALTGAGGNPTGWAGLGYYLLVAGLALIAVRTVRRRNEVKQ
jgi:hypothetical protein